VIPNVIGGRSLPAAAVGRADVDEAVTAAGKPRDVTHDEEIPASIDVIRFYAGACRSAMLLPGSVA
jgi:hypothetical protein